MSVTLAGKKHVLQPGGYAFLPPASGWTVAQRSGAPARFHWIRKAYESVEGLDVPPKPSSPTSSDIAPTPMPGTEGRWATTRFVDPDRPAPRHACHHRHLEPGAVIPFAETHVMEHGLYVLEGKAVYRLNQDWVEVEAGDYMWLRAFCPQACYAGGPGKFRYLLYKDVNRHMKLGAAGVGGGLHGMSRVIVAEPLTRENFAGFGDVIDMGGDHHYPINGGKTERYHDLARAEAAGPNAHVLINIFSGTPYAFPLKLSMVERHPFGSQAFIPLSPRPFLVVVCHDGEDGPGEPHAFVTAARAGRQLSAQSLARRADADRRAAGFPRRRPRRRRLQSRRVPLLASLRNPPSRRSSTMTDVSLIDRLLDVIEHDIVPKTADGVAHGNKLFGAAILRKDDRSLVLAETNNEIGKPALARRGALPEALLRNAEGRARPTRRTAIFLATHEPCSLCLSAITWTGFDNFYYLFSHEDSRDSFAIPHDLKILKEVFTLDPGGYNAENAYWKSFSHPQAGARPAGGRADAAGSADRQDIRPLRRTVRRLPGRARPKTTFR